MAQDANVIAGRNIAGSKNPNWKGGGEDIRSSVFTTSKLARIYKMSYQSIWQIRKGQTWNDAV